MEMFEIRLKIHFFSWGSNQQHPSIGLDNGSAPFKRQAISWTIDG